MIIQRASRQNKVVLIGGSTLSKLAVETIFATSDDFTIVATVDDVSQLEGAVDDFRPHIVLIDLCSGRIDGFAALGSLTFHKSLRKFLISVEALPASEQSRYLEAGANGFFAKKAMIQDQADFFRRFRLLAEGGKNGAMAEVEVQIETEFHGEPELRVETAAEIKGDDAPHLLDAVPLEPPARPMADIIAVPEVHGIKALPARYPDAEMMRQAAVHALRAANGERDRRLDLIVKHLCNVTGYPMAAVTLIDGSTQWIKAAAGLDRGATPRAEAICDSTIRFDTPMIVADTWDHPIFAGFACVTGNPHVRSYVGVPLIVECGLAVGALCVMDTQPRKWVQSELVVLKDLAALVASMLEHEAYSQAA